MNQTKKILIIAVIGLVVITGLALVGNRYATSSRIDSAKIVIGSQSAEGRSDSQTITDETPLKEVFAIRNEISGTSYNFAENATVKIRTAEENNSLALFVTPQNIPIDVVEVRLKFDPNQTTVQNIRGAENFPDSTESLFNNTEGWAVIYAPKNPESLIFDQETLVGSIEYQGTNTFSIVQNRSLAISNSTLIELSL